MTIPYSSTILKPLAISPYYPLSKSDKVRINEAIRASEVRVISDELGNLGVLSVREAIAKAREHGLDLIEISPDANPPVAKIMDYGKYQYSQKKKQKEIKAKTNTASSEVKSIQVKVGTGDNDLMLKAKKASEWLSEGHRVKVELFLRGRTKFMDKKFLEERLNRVLQMVETPYKVVDPLKESPKGIMVTIEKQR